MAAVTITDLLEAGVHFGHQTKRWNPKMKPYLFGARNGISIFDLTKTIRHLADACEFARDTVADGGVILFVGSKRQAQETLKAAADSCGQPNMCDRWLGGTLTNFGVIHRRVQYLRDLQEMQTSGSMDKMTKKEQAKLRLEYKKLNQTLGGIINMDNLPDALFIVDVLHEEIAIKEANRLGIPVIAIVDSNGNPEGVDKVIPGNDDALRSITVLTNAMVAAVTEGKAHFAKRREAVETEAVKEAKANIEADQEAEQAKRG